MDDLQLFLNQTKKYVENNEQVQNTTLFPYQTDFSFLDKYPYELVKIGVPEYLRVDGVGTHVTGAL